MDAEPTAVHTALEVIRVKLRDGTADDVAQTITAELNDIGSAQEVLLHAIETINACASMAVAALQRLANETHQDVEALYDQMRRIYGKHDSGP